MEATKNADIVVSATGVPQLVRGDWLKPGAIVIDVGTTAIEVSFFWFLSVSVVQVPLPEFFFPSLVN